ncbi:DUF3560 domain-containing protein [Deinococcus hohokamensis]|uniref:DUF3560 domain-containing protein n=1 Tax=Deinococcus hohokamensis TaxID=309883 RepID=A0ABV9I3R9_9DEIO
MTGEVTNGTATYHLDDDTLRWTPDTRLDDVEYAEARKLGFRWWRGSQAWVATWTPTREDFVLRFVEGIEHEADPDDPSGRLERFAARAVAATGRSNQRAAAAMQGLPPGGEPIKVGHHSERRHRRAIERSDQHMRKAVEESDKAAYWRSRAQGTERRARQKADPGVVRRRIAKLEADLRRQQRYLSDVPGMNPGGPLPEGSASRRYTERWAAHLALRIAYEQARLESLAPPPFAPLASYKKGDVVKTKRYGKCEVLSVGRVNLKVAQLEGHTKGWVWTVPPHDVEPWRETGQLT